MFTLGQTLIESVSKQAVCVCGRECRYFTVTVDLLKLTYATETLALKLTVERAL